jgi:hypothetical protein
MYKRDELKQLKREFWESFAAYCEVQPNLKGRKRMWMLYNTKVKGVELKFDVGRNGAAVILEVNSRPEEKRKEMYEKLGWYKEYLEKDIPGGLVWVEDYKRESGEIVSRLYAERTGIDFHRREDWGEFFQFMCANMYVLEKNLLKISDWIREE